jgi:ABC-2 type transport system permease protein
MEYRTSFALQVLGSFLLSFVDFVVILVIFTHLPRFDGWSLDEVAFLYGSSYVTFRLADIVFTNLDRLPMLIRLGTLDQVLTRPLGSLGQVLTGDLDIRHVGGMLQGGLVMILALSRASIEWTPARVAVLGLMLLSAPVIFGSVWVATNAIAFWTTDAREVANAFTYGGNFLTHYPFSIYGRWMRRLFTYAVPLGFVNYYPALYLLGKRDPLGTPAVLSFLSPAVAVGTALIAGLVWLTAVRRYRSTGS